jgi:hypothetical protein
MSQTVLRDEKAEISMVENAEHERDIEAASLKGDDVQQDVDYSGFAQKTDPAEIKLVRKLDIRIMVS